MAALITRSNCKVFYITVLRKVLSTKVKFHQHLFAENASVDLRKTQSSVVLRHLFTV
jgi:hypothetical protein